MNALPDIPENDEEREWRNRGSVISKTAVGRAVECGMEVVRTAPPGLVPSAQYIYVRESVCAFLNHIKKRS